MSYQPTTSPWDTVNNPPEQAREYYGALTINAWFCMLVKGQGKLPYDDKAIDPEGKPYRRYTAIDLTLTPLVESGLEWDVNRTMLAEFGEWKDITLPSLRDLGVLDASQINGKFARIALVPTGRTYVSNGETRDATAVQFLGVFDTREQCLAAFEANGGTPAAAPAQAAPAAQPGQPSPNGNERETALKFAGAYVKNAVRQGAGDLDKTRQILDGMIQQQAIIARHFNVDSPEIVELMTAEMAPF